VAVAGAIDARKRTMTQLATLAIWVLAGVQLLGLASACLARMSEGRSWQTTCQRLFMGALGLAGLGAVAAFAMGPGHFMLSGASLATMVLGAVWDFGGSSQPTLS
jgi:hypothetical protein